MVDTKTAGTVDETTTQAATTPAQSDSPSPAPTLAGTPAEAPPEPSDGPGFWPEDWRSRMAGSDERMLKHLGRFASPEGVYKSWRQYEKQRNDGRLQRARPDTDDEKALAEWRKEIGAPDTPEGYLADLPAEIKIGEADEAALKEVFATMHAEGIPTSQAKAVVAKYYETVAKGLQQRQDADRAYRANAEDELRSEWGPEYRANLNAIGVLMDSHGDGELFNWLQEARGPDGARLGDNPKALKFFAGLAREIHPDGLVTITPTAGMSRSDAMSSELAQLEMEMRDTKGRDPAGYWNNPNKQTRYRELITARDRMAARTR